VGVNGLASRKWNYSLFPQKARIKKINFFFYCIGMFRQHGAALAGCLTWGHACMYKAIIVPIVRDL
jgi:hypothetical protein